MIKVEQIRKVFNARTKNANEVLKGVSFELPEKGLVAIFGKSGSGKTTLLNIIGGLDKQNSGKIFINGENVSGKVDYIRNSSIGFIFQNYYLEAGYTIEEIMENSMKIAGFTDKEEIKRRSDEVLKLVKMDRFKNKTADALSGGQKQRVAIARALIKGSDIILADEPTGNLDSENTYMVMDILKEISKTKLVVLVTHEVNLIHKYADSHIKLVDGQLVNNSELDPELDIEVEKNDIYLDSLNKRTINIDNANINVYGDDINCADIEIIQEDGTTYIKPGKGVKVLNEKSEKRVIKEKPVEQKEEINNVPSFTKSNSKRNGRFFTLKNIFKSKRANDEKSSSVANVFKQIFLVAMATLTCFFSYGINETLNKHADNKVINPTSMYLDIKTYPVIRFLDESLYDSIDFFSLDYDKGTFNYKNQQAVSSIEEDYIPTSLDIDDPSKGINLLFGEMPKSKEVLVTRKLADNLKAQLRYDEFQKDQAILLLLFNKNYHISGIVEGVEPRIYMNRVDYVNFLSVYKEIKFQDSSNQFFEPDFISKETGETINSYRASIDLHESKTLTLKDNEARVEINRSSTYLMMKDSKDADYKIDKVNRILFKSPEYINILNSNPVFIKQFSLNRKEMNEDIKIYVNKHTLNNIFAYIAPNLDLINKDGSYFFEVKTANLEQYEELSNLLKSKYGLKSIDIESLYQSQEDEMKKNDMNILLTFGAILGLLLIIYYFIEKSNSIKNSKEYGIFRAIGINKSNLLYKETVLAAKDSLISYLLASLVVAILIGTRYFMMNLPLGGFISITLLMCLIVSILMIGISLIPYLFVISKTPSEIISRYDI